MAGETTVKVHGRDIAISVHQRSKTVWVASGEYMGQVISVTGRTQTQAISQWREAARYIGG